MRSRFEKIRLVIALLLPFVGINQLTHWVFPVLSIILLFMSSERRLHYPATFMTITLVYLFWIIFTGLMSGDFYNPFRKFSESIILFVWVILMINLFMQQKKIMVNTVFCSGTIVGVFLLLNVEGFAIDFTDLPFGKNGVAVFLFTSLVFGLGTKTGRMKIFGITAIVVSIFLSGSLKNIFATILVLIFQLKNFGNLKFGSLIFASFLGIFIYYLDKIELVLLTSVTYLFALSKVQVLFGYTPELDFAVDTVSNRRDLIRGGLELFYDNPLTGIGLENSRLFLPTYTHNHFVELLASMGVIGFFLFSLFYLPFSKFTLRSMNFGFIVFSSYLIIGFGSRLYDNYSFFLLLSFGWAALISKSTNHIFIMHKK